MFIGVFLPSGYLSFFSFSLFRVTCALHCTCTHCQYIILCKIIIRTCACACGPKTKLREIRKEKRESKSAYIIGRYTRVLPEYATHEYRGKADRTISPSSGRGLSLSVYKATSNPLPLNIRSLYSRYSVYTPVMLLLIFAGECDTSRKIEKQKNKKKQKKKNKKQLHGVKSLAALLKKKKFFSSIDVILRDEKHEVYIRATIMRISYARVLLNKRQVCFVQRGSDLPFEFLVEYIFARERGKTKKKERSISEIFIHAREK